MVTSGAGVEGTPLDAELLRHVPPAGPDGRPAPAGPDGADGAAGRGAVPASPDLPPAFAAAPLDLSLGEPPPLYRRPAAVAPAPRWVAPLYALFAVILVPWIVLLAETLPARETSEHWDVAWVGFDVMIFVGLALTAYCAARRSTWVKEAAIALSTLLVVDAWFDCLTARWGVGLVQALAEALIVELPLAGLSLWIARNAEAVNERTTRWLRWRTERQAARLRTREAARGRPGAPRRTPGQPRRAETPDKIPSAGDFRP